MGTEQNRTEQKRRRSTRWWLRRSVAITLVAIFASLSVGFRRTTPGLACARTLPRSLSVSLHGSRFPDWVSPDFVGDATRTRTITHDDLDPVFAFDTVHWRGDSSSYVDVFFDTPIRDSTAEPTIYGAEFGPFVRYEWWPLDIGPGVLNLDPVATAAGLGLPGLSRQLSFTNPTALRHYDRGECSAAAPWRMLADAFVDELDRHVFDAYQGYHVGLFFCGARPSGNWEITPILRPEVLGQSLDAFRISRPYTVMVCGGTTPTVQLSVTGRFAAIGGQLRYRFESARATGAGADDLRTALETQLAPAINVALPGIMARVVPAMGMRMGPLLRCTVGSVGDGICLQSLNQLLPAIVTGVTLAPHNALCKPDTNSETGGGCAIVPNVERVYERPEGIELILSDYGPGDGVLNAAWLPDPLYPILAQSPGVCGYRVPVATTTGGYMGTVFEIPPARTPLPFGDHP